MFAKKGRILTIDMDAVKEVKTPVLKASNAAMKKRNELKKLDPLSDPWKKRRYATAQELKEKIDEYFNSCYGSKYYKGRLVFDADGNPAIGQVEPFTISGLARHLGISRDTLKQYETRALMGEIPYDYAEVVRDARMRVQEYAEKRLYDKEGSAGARFVLEAGFGWMTKKERQELKLSKQRIKVAQAKLKLLQAAADAKTMDDKEFIVSILRASDEN